MKMTRQTVAGCLAGLAASVLLAAPAAIAAERTCFQSCMEKHKPKTDDYFSFADDVKACRDDCDLAAIDGLKADGLYEAYAACTPEPLSKQEFRDLRAANPSWQASFNIFTWDIRNTLPGKILTEIEVGTQDMNLIAVTFTSQTVIAPGKTGTFVVTDFFDGYPAVRYATRVKGAKACSLP